MVAATSSRSPASTPDPARELQITDRQEVQRPTLVRYAGVSPAHAPPFQTKLRSQPRPIGEENKEPGALLGVEGAAAPPANCQPPCRIRAPRRAGRSPEFMYGLRC